jgi:hypothetical protein
MPGILCAPIKKFSLIALFFSFVPLPSLKFGRLATVGATAVNRKPDTPTVTEIKGKVAAIIEDRKQANNLVDVIGYLGEYKKPKKITCYNKLIICTVPILSDVVDSDPHHFG